MKTLLSIVLLAVVAGAHAADRWYNVEMIVFAHNDEAGLWEEYWPDDPGAPDNSGAVSLVADAGELETLPGQLIEFEELPLAMLADPLESLRRSGRYRVIHATAWRLPGLAQDLAPSVRIQAGRRFTEWGALIPQDADTGQAADSDAAAQLPQVQAQDRLQQQTGPQAGLDLATDAPPEYALYEIDGRIKISLSQYLDVDADLLFRDNVSLPDADGLPIQSLRAFRLSEYRRMKRNSVHYFDHPLFGVVIGVDRHEPLLNGGDGAP